MLIFSILLLLMVGAVFVYSPASILSGMVGDGSNSGFMIWVAIILGYYVIATLLPVDKIIGRIYPVFAVALIFMAVGMMGGLLSRWPSIPEFWQGLETELPRPVHTSLSSHTCSFQSPVVLSVASMLPRAL